MNDLNLEKRIKRLEREVKKLKSRNFGSKYIENFDFDSEDIWDTIERNIHKRGIILEYEIINILKEINSDFSHHDTFLYPKNPIKFFIDYYFHNNRYFNIRKLDKLQEKKLETDIIIDEYDKIIDNEIKINLNYKYIIECKSRSHPPINYLIFPNFIYKKAFNHNYPKENYKSRINFKSSQFGGDFRLKSRLWTTSIDPVKIRADNLHLDHSRLFEKAFWQLFKRIDYESNFGFDLLLFNNFFLEEGKSFFESLKIPNHLSMVKNKIDEIKKDENLSFLRNIQMKITIFIPIIIINSNLYAIDLNKSKDIPLIEKKTKINGFVKNYSYLTIKNTKKNLRYTNLKRFMMEYLKSHKICFENDQFFPNINKPSLDIIFLSSHSFKKSFKNIKTQIKKKYKKFIRKTMIPSYIKYLDDIKDFKILSLFLHHNLKLRWDFIKAVYEEYKKNVKKRK